MSIYLLLIFANHSFYLIPTIGILLLPFFATIDWLTQALELRESNNILRVISGGLFGIWLAIGVNALLTVDGKMILYYLLQSIVYIGLVLLILGLNKGSIDNYLKPYEEFVATYEKQKNNI